MKNKQFLSFLIAIVLMSAIFLSIVQASENKTVILDIPGMTCNMCPITIRMALENTPGVIEAKANFETKTATVTFDPFETNVELLSQATGNAGYPSTLKQ